MYAGDVERLAPEAAGAKRLLRRWAILAPASPGHGGARVAGRRPTAADDDADRRDDQRPPVPAHARRSGSRTGAVRDVLRRVSRPERVRGRHRREARLPAAALVPYG